MSSAAYASGVAASPVASTYSLPVHCRVRRNLSFRRYDRSPIDAICFLILYCKRYNWYPIDDLLFLSFSCRNYYQSSIYAIFLLSLSLLALSAEVYLILNNVELGLSI